MKAVAFACATLLVGASAFMQPAPKAATAAPKVRPSSQVSRNRRRRLRCVIGERFKRRNWIDGMVLCLSAGQGQIFVAAVLACDDDREAVCCCSSFPLRRLGLASLP